MTSWWRTTDGGLVSTGAPPSVATVIVPAHDEERVLERCLRRLLTDAGPGELDVVVVANACRDRTADIARRVGVRVIETPVAGKINAIRLGDASCAGFPRVYLDADVELDTYSMRALATTARTPGVLACAPRPVWDLRGTGLIVRRVHRVHDAVMASRRGLAGCGVYVLSEAGHARAFPLPDVLADDEWMHRRFAETERRVVGEATVVVRPARSLRAHLHRRVRVRIGNHQLARLGYPAVGGRMGLDVLAEATRARTIGPLDAACYLAVQVIDRGLTAWRRLRRLDAAWATDIGSRSAAC